MAECLARTWSTFFGAAILVTIASSAFAQAPAPHDIPQGITAPVVFPPFDPTTVSCAGPPGLARALVFAQDNERQFMQGVGRGLALAASDRSLSFRIALARNDAGLMIEQVEALATEKIGAIVVAPVDAPSLAP